jgi:DNA-binding response OmpR family regulator
VDDEETMVQLAVIALERLGFEAHATTSPHRALEMFESQPRFYDLVLTDHLMPDMLGHDLAARMRRIRPGVPVVVATANGEVYRERDAKQAGFEYLPKPHTMAHLRATIEAALSRDVSSDDECAGA